MIWVKHAGLGAAAFALAILAFAGMHFLIRTDGFFEQPDRARAYLNFIRVDPADDPVRTKDRRLPEPPPPPDEAPETPDFSAELDVVNAKLGMSMPTIEAPVNDGDGPWLGALQSGQGLQGFDTDAIPVVRVPPAYPRRAKQAGIEGFVTMEVTIRPDGTVSNARVTASEPPRLFDDAALAAMRRWKFRPKIVDGAPMAQRARQTIAFTLDSG